MTRRDAAGTTERKAQMLHRFRARFSSAHAIAALALFFALAGGSAIALQGKNSVDSGDIKKNAVKSADIARNAVKSPDIARNAVKSPDIADGAVGPADLAPAEALHRLGAPGEPGFSDGGQNDCLWSARAATSSGLPVQPAGFFKDPYGLVHLQGIVARQAGPGGDASCDGDDLGDVRAFTLPEGYRPVEAALIPGVVTVDSGALLIIGGVSDRVSGSSNLPAGSVAIGGPPGDSLILLDGISFRAAP